MKTLPCLMLVLIAAGSPTSQAQERIGAFMLQAQRDDGSGELRRSITSLPIAASASPTQGVALIWICANSNLRVLYTFDIPLRGDDSGAITIRMRSAAGPTVEREWWISSGGRRAVLPVGDEVEINALASSEEGLVTEVHDPADNRRMSHRFETRGFNKALEYLPCAER